MVNRSTKLAGEVRSIIAPQLRECPSECGVVSITDVVVSDDCSFATVYISALSEPEIALTFFKKKEKQLQRSLSSLKNKRIPKLRFAYDKSSERGSRIENLLKQSDKDQ